MARQHKKGFTAKPADGREADPKTLQAVKDRAREGEMPCAVAFAVARKLKVSPGDVGFAADKLGIALTRCQMGLFGYRPEKRVVKPADLVTADLEKALRSGLSNDRLPCKTAWEIAGGLGIPKMAVASACETLKIKIGPCQLGAF